MSTKRTHPKRSSGWSAAKIKSVIDYYDHQSDEDGANEIETAAAAPSVTLIEVPNELLPQVRNLISRHRKSA